MLKNLFSKKKDGFYLQVEESSVPDAVPAVEAASAPVETTVEPTTTAVSAETPKAKKTSVKDKKKSEQKTVAAPAATPEPVVAAATVFTNFAPDYLIKPSSNSSRRRPGANMQRFVSMAREVKK